MINSVTVTNHLGESMKMELRFPEKSGFLIQEITGLSPTKANINFTELASSDGALYNSSRLTTRNIVLSLLFLWSPTVEAVRQLSYKYFPIKKQIKLTIETDTRICETYGYVESNEADIFSSQEGTQISILCPDPYLYASGNPTLTIFSGIENIFEFPFSNESIAIDDEPIAPEELLVNGIWNDTLIWNDLFIWEENPVPFVPGQGTPCEDLMVMSELLVDSIQTVFYEGDADVGILITMYANGTVTNPMIYNTTTNEVMRISTDRLFSLTGLAFERGDVIKISTVKGRKTIKLIKDGVTINILNILDKNTDWFRISKGDNVFGFMADEGAENVQFMIENQTIYEGV